MNPTPARLLINHILSFYKSHFLICLEIDKLALYNAWPDDGFPRTGVTLFALPFTKYISTQIFEHILSQKPK